MYEYKCEIVRVVDGDTVDVNIDYEEHNVSNNDIREDFKKQGFKTVPQIWNEKNKHIGGYDDLKSYIYDSQWKHIDGYKGE